MNIRIVLDEENGTDPIDPSGEILISDGRGLISEKNAYLDSWLDALITGLKEVEAGKSASMDLVEEPSTLRFDPQDGGLSITYRNTTLSLESIEEFRRVLRNVAKSFLDKVNPTEVATKNELLDSIRNFTKHE